MLRPSSLFFGLALAAGLALPLRADTVSLTSVKDNSLFSTSTNSNGAGDAIFSGRTGTSGGNAVLRGLLAFDVAGNIYYVFNARCPIRSEAYDWRSAVPGWLPATDWKGNLDYTRLPQLLNPPSGFLQNCNTAAHLVTVESGLDPDAFPRYLGRGGFNDRGLRALNWLNAQSRVVRWPLRMRASRV